MPYSFSLIVRFCSLIGFSELPKKPVPIFYLPERSFILLDMSGHTLPGRQRAKMNQFKKIKHKKTEENK